MGNEWSQSFYQIQNKHKYLGKQEPFFRSSWEEKFMKYCDFNDNILKWCSECVIIPYRLSTDPPNAKLRKYITDFFVVVKGKDNQIKKYVIEIKPRKQIDKPKAPKTKHSRSMKRYINECEMWVKNQCKWKYAKVYCEQKGWVFQIVDQKILKMEFKLN